MSPEDERQYARSLIARALASHARVELESGRVPPTAEEEEDLAAAVHAALYGVGRLQPLLDDPMVENIDINGCDRVFVGYADGREVMPTRSPRPTRSWSSWCRRWPPTRACPAGRSTRPTRSSTCGCRTAPGCRRSWRSAGRPVVSIRRARLPKVVLDDLVGNGTIDRGHGGVPARGGGARKNIMIAGATNAGKTTMLRALANEIPRTSG